MISLGSMPWRYAEVVPRSVCWRWMMLTATPSRASSTAWAWAQLMQRGPASDPGLDGEVAQLGPRGGGRPPSSAGLTIDDAEQRAGWQRDAVSEPGGQLLEPEWVHPSLAALVALAVTHHHRPTARIDIGLVERQRLRDPQATTPQHRDQPGSGDRGDPGRPGA